MLGTHSTGAARRSRAGKSAAHTMIALIGALALTFGTGALAASATEGAGDAAGTVDSSGSSLTETPPTADGQAGDSGGQDAGAGGADGGEVDDGAAGAGADGAGDSAAGGDGTESGGDESAFSAQGMTNGASDREAKQDNRDGKKDGRGGGDELRNDRGGNDKDDRGKDGKDKDGKGKDDKDKDGKDKGKDDRDKGKDKDKDKDRPKGNTKVCHPRGDGGWEPQTPNVADIVAPQSESRAVGGSDIIPAFSYTQGDRTHTYPGQNWDDEGQELWKNDCKPKPPTISVDPVQCEVPGGEPPATVPVSLGKLKKGQHYTVTVTLDGEQVSQQKFTAEGHTAVLDMPVAGAADGYVATVSQKWSKHEVSTEFDVWPCPPVPVELTISGAAGQCVAVSTPGTALVTVGGLEPDGVYEVSLWFGEELIGTQTIEYPEGASAQLTFSVTQFGEYTAEVVRAGGGEMGLMRVEWPEEPAQSASVVFVAGEKCPVPVTPAVVVTPKLAVTGSETPATAMLAGGLLLVLGGGLIVAQRVGRLGRG